MLSAGPRGLGRLSGRHLPDMASACWAFSWCRDSCENFDLVNLHKKTVGSAKLRDNEGRKEGRDETYLGSLTAWRMEAGITIEIPPLPQSLIPLPALDLFMASFEKLNFA